MPDLDANGVVLDTSADTELDDVLDIQGEGALDDQGNGAESSDAQDGAEGARSTIDVVRDVVGERKPAEGSSPEGQKEGEAADPKANQAAKEPDDEKFSDVPFHKHPRFQQLLKQRDSLKGDAERYKNVETFLRQNNVAAEEASQALTIAALLKTDPVKAWETLQPIVKQLLVDAGVVLPSDLRARVEAQELTEDAAKEIAKERASRTTVERKQQVTETQVETDRRTAFVEGLRTAANTWEAERTTKDPNFAAKKPLIMKELAWIHTTEGKADSPAKVREQLERAYKAVGTVAVPARTKSAAPTVGQATRQRPAGSGSASPTTQRAQEPVGALKFIKATVAAREAAA